MNVSVAIATFSQGQTTVGGYDNLIKRNQAIASKLLPKLAPNSYELVIFHDGSISPEHQKKITKASGTKLKFINVLKTAPKTGFNPAKEIPCVFELPEDASYFSRHLCHFWFVDFLDYLDGYDYLIHIDENTVLIDSPNIVEVMQNQNLKFLTAEQKNISPNTSASLPEFSSFFRAGKLEPYIDLSGYSVGPRTNCMAIDLNHFRDLQPFKQFTGAIDAWGMIYSHLWSLGALWSIFLKMYVDPAQYGPNCKAWSFLDPEAGIIINPLSEQLADLSNIALNKQASTNLEYYPPHDGIESHANNVVSGVFHGKYTFHTLHGDDPTWTVDLEEVHPVKAIQIYNRDDGQQQRALGMLVQISDDGETFHTIHEQNELFYGLHRGPLLIDFRALNKEIAFRFLRLKIPRNECFHLDQVEIYSIVA